MKKLYYSTLAVVTAFVLFAPVMTKWSHAANFQRRALIAGPLIISNAQNLTIASSNVLYTNLLNYNGLSLFGTNSTNQYAVYSLTNLYLSNGTLSTNINIGVFPSAFTDARLVANSLGDLNTNQICLINCTGLSTNTNTINVTLTRGDGTNFGTTAADQFKFTAVCNGTTNIIIVTNLPNWFLQGSGFIRAGLSNANTTSGSNVLVNVLEIQGWVP